MNELLFQLYDEERRLSTMLAQLGFDKVDVQRLRANHLEEIVARFVALIQSQIMEIRDGERLLIIMTKRFSLDGQPQHTLQGLGQNLGISRERVRQLQAKCVRRLRTRKRKAALEDGLRQIANDLLQKGVADVRPE